MNLKHSYKSIGLFFILAIMLSHASFAQQPGKKKPGKPVLTDPDPSYIATTYPIRTFGNYLMMGFEKKYAPTKTVKLIMAGASYEYNNSGALASQRRNMDLYSLAGFRVEIQPRFYMNKKAYRRYFIAPTVGYKFTSYHTNLWGPIFSGKPEKGDHYTASSVMAGYVVGYNFKVGEFGYIDLYVGEVVQNAFGSYRLAISPQDNYKNGIGMHLGFSAGIGF